MSYVNYNQGQQQAGAETVEFETVTRKSFTGKVTRDPKVNRTTNGNSVLNLDFVIEDERFDGGAQFARITFWGEEAHIVEAFIKKNNNFLGSGIPKWTEYTLTQGENAGEVRKQLEYDYPSIHFNLEQMKEFIRGEISMALRALQPNTQTQAPVQQVPEQTQAPVQQPVQQQPVKTVEEEFGGQTLDISSDDLPF